MTANAHYLAPRPVHQINDGHIHVWGWRLVHDLDVDAYTKPNHIGAFCVRCGLEDYKRVPEVELGLISCTHWTAYRA